MNRIRKFLLSPESTSTVFGLGLLTEEPDYRLCWMLNQNFAWNLERSDDIIITAKNSPVPQSYSCFESRSGHSPAIMIIANRSGEGFWLTNFRQIDFFLVASPPDPEGLYLDELKTGIATKIPQIRGLFKVPLPSFCYL